MEMETRVSLEIHKLGINQLDSVHQDHKTLVNVHIFRISNRKWNNLLQLPLVKAFCPNHRELLPRRSTISNQKASSSAQAIDREKALFYVSSCVGCLYTS